MAVPSLFAMLKALVEQGGSELHITVGSPPQIRVGGRLRPLSTPPLTPTDTEQRFKSCMKVEHEKKLLEFGFVRFSIGVKGLADFIISVYLRRGAWSGVISTSIYIKTFSELRLPHAVERFCESRAGLLLVGGPRKSGKSSTLAAIVDKINKENGEKILVFEGVSTPLHTHQACLVDHITVGEDIANMEQAMELVLASKADCVAVDGLSGCEYFLNALRLAQVGVLVIATVFGNTTTDVLENSIFQFPPHYQYSIRNQIAQTLIGVVAQDLLPPPRGKRMTLAIEVLVGSKGLSNLIRRNQLRSIYNYIQSGRGRGMQTMNQSLAANYLKRLATMQAVLSRSPDPDELMQIIDKG